MSVLNLTKVAFNVISSIFVCTKKDVLFHCSKIVFLITFTEMMYYFAAVKQW